MVFVNAQTGVGRRSPPAVRVHGVRTEHDGLRQSCVSVGLCVKAHDARLDTSEVNEVVEIGGWAGATKILACHLESEYVDPMIRSEGGSEQVAVEISFATENPSCRRGRGRRNELPSRRTKSSRSPLPDTPTVRL
jgi:hypothetical protein